MIFAALGSPLQHASQAWRSWREHVAYQQLLRAKGAAVVAALQHGAACRAWRAWTAYTNNRQSKRQQVVELASLPAAHGLMRRIADACVPAKAAR